MIPQLLSISSEQYTPEWVAKASRAAMGRIDLDPASCRVANRTIRAEKYFTAKSDGLRRNWFGRVFLNPPGGVFLLKDKEIIEQKLTKAQATAIREAYKAEFERWGTRSRAFAWWKKLMEEVKAGRTEEAIFLGFTLEILRTTQECQTGSAMDFPFCVPRERIEFSGGSQPTHGNVIVYVGPNVTRFTEVFSEFGRCR